MSLYPPAEEKKLKKKGKGKLDVTIGELSNIIAVRWYDNKAVQLVPTYVDINPQEACKRWSKEDNKSIQASLESVRHNISFSLLDFHTHIASGLTMTGNFVQHKRRRPPTEGIRTPKKRLVAPWPISDNIYDDTG
ncbi:uncharacterized protein LOC124555967 [Schistocerca americana]|uniref:uncharacterized protein LOC124555967 n=1 Tax=Schistocerca americana TaxID=7009 RepID=UPI001F4F9753|nr:uncharacterized protein LOC124555967 [Schistocerca americana]